MKILIIILFITLLFHNKKEGWPWNKKKKKKKPPPPPPPPPPPAQRSTPPPPRPSISECRNFYSRRPRPGGFIGAICRNTWRQMDAENAAAAAAAEKRRRDEERRRAELKRNKLECARKLIDFNGIARERSMWEQKKNDLINQPTYRDRNFNQIISKMYEDEMTILNTSINENTKLNTDLNNILKRIKIYQNNNYQMIDKLKTQNTSLKECKMNKELTDNDYDVLN